MKNKEMLRKIYYENKAINRNMQRLVNIGLIGILGGAAKEAKVSDLMKDGKLGCGGLIAIILLIFAFLNDFAEELGGAFQLFMWIGLIIIIAAVVKFLHDN